MAIRGSDNGRHSLRLSAGPETHSLLYIPDYYHPNMTDEEQRLEGPYIGTLEIFLKMKDNADTR